jgi:hypothetical protein
MMIKMADIESRALAAGLRTVSKGLAEIAAALEGRGQPGSDYDSRKAAAFRRLKVPEAEGLDQKQASAACIENGLSPRTFGTWVGQGLAERVGDRRFLSEKGLKWLADYDARQAG